MLLYKLNGEIFAALGYQKNPDTCCINLCLMTCGCNGYKCCSCCSNGCGSFCKMICPSCEGGCGACCEKCISASCEKCKVCCKKCFCAPCEKCKACCDCEEGGCGGCCKKCFCAPCEKCKACCESLGECGECCKKCFCAPCTQCCSCELDKHLDLRFLNTMDEAINLQAGIYVGSTKVPFKICKDIYTYVKVGEKFKIKITGMCSNTYDIMLNENDTKCGKVEANVPCCGEISFVITLPEDGTPIEKLMLISAIFTIDYINTTSISKPKLIMTDKWKTLPGLNSDFNF